MSNTIEYFDFDAEEAANREALQTKLKTIDKAIEYIKEGKKTLLNPINHNEKELQETISKSKKIPTSIIDRIRNKVQDASGKTTAPFKLTTLGNDNDNSDHSYKIDTQSRQISTCSICGQEVELVNLRKHIEVTCVGLPMTCSEIGCGAVFPRSELKNHQKKECIVAKKRRQMVESSVVRKNNAAIDLENFLKPSVKIQHPKAPPLPMTNDENVENNDSNIDLLEIQFQSQLKIDMENALLSKLTECKDCGEEIRVTQIEYHQKNKCKNRLIYCSNRAYGCNEEVPLSSLKKHLESICIVEKKKEVMIANSNLRRELVVCIGCGQSIPLMFMKQHEDDSIIGTFPKCTNRRVHCKNHSHGCDVMVRLNDRKKHEEVDGGKSIRTALYFDGDGACMSINEDDIPCPWTAEYWLYRPPAEESAKCFLKNFSANLINYAAKWKLEYAQRTKVMGMINLLKGDGTGQDMGEKERKKLVKKLAGQVIIYEDLSLGTYKACQELEISIRGVELSIDEIKASGGFDAVTTLVPIQPGHKERLRDDFLERERKEKELVSKNKPEKDIENMITPKSSTKKLGYTKLNVIPPKPPAVEINQETVQIILQDENIEKDFNLTQEENVNNIFVENMEEEKDEEIISQIVTPEEVIKMPDPDEYIGLIYKIVDLALLDKQKAWGDTENITSDELIKILIKMSNNKKKGLKLLVNTKASWNQYLSCMQPIHYALIKDQALLVEWRVEAGLIEKEKKNKKEKKLTKEEIKKAAKKAKDLKRRELKKKKGKESIAVEIEGDVKVEKNEEEEEEKEDDRGKLKDRAADLIRVGVGAEVLAISNTVCKNTGGHCRICIDLNGKVGIVTTKGVVTGGAESFEFSSTVPRQQWVHIAFTCTESPKNRVTLYINGESVGTAIGCAFPLPMGRLGGAPGYHSFVGALLDVRYWRKLRSAVEIQRSRNRVIDMNANSNVSTAKDNKRIKKKKNEVEENDNDKTQQIDLSNNGIVCYYPFEDGLIAPNVYDVTEYRFRTEITPAPENKAKGFTWLNVEFMPIIKEIDHSKPRDFEEPIVPLPSYQQRGLCQVQLKRFRMAMQGRALQREVDCPLGCGDKIRMVAVRFHVGFECMKRRIRCRFDTCMESFPLQDQQQHELYECEQIYIRDDILERKAKKAKPVLCQFCSESIMKKDLKKHVKNECIHRTISCIHPDCEITMQAHNLDEHLKYKCTSISIKKKIWLISRARKRCDYPRPWGIEISVDGDENDTTDNENEISQDENLINEKTIDVIE